MPKWQRKKEVKKRDKFFSPLSPLIEKLRKRGFLFMTRIDADIIIDYN